MAITLFIFPANLVAGYSKVFHDLRNYSQYHVNKSMSPKFDIDFRDIAIKATMMGCLYTHFRFKTYNKI